MSPVVHDVGVAGKSDDDGHCGSADASPEGGPVGTPASKPGKAQKKPAAAPIVPTLTAVVFDTNLWGKGTLDVAQLMKHAKRLAKSGVQVWVPRQVLLERVSHTVADAAAAEPIWKRLRRADMVSTKFPVPVETPAVLKEVEAKVSAIPNVKVLPITGDAAIAGIEDQILGTGAGEVRNGVKTGAVDSSWVRDAVAAAGGDASLLVFVTGNAKDVQATAKEAGFGPVNIRSEHALYSSLFGASAAPDKLTQLIAAHLETLVSDPADDPDPHPFPVDSMLPITDIELGGAILDYPYPIEPTEVTLAPGSKIVAMVGVEVVDGPGPSDDNASVGATVDKPFSSTVEFHLLVLTDLAVSGYELDEDGQVQMHSADAYSNVVLAPVVADVEDLHVEVTPNGLSSADTAEERFTEGHDGLEWLLGELANLAGVTLVDDDSTLDEFLLTAVDSISVVATLEGDAYEEWELVFDLGDDSVSVSCVYDAGARVWAGSDSFDSRPPYYLVSGNLDDGFGAGEPYSAISAVWHYLNQL